MTWAETMRMLNGLDGPTLAAFARYEQGRADRLQAMAARAQREADAARKLIKRRKREARA